MTFQRAATHIANYTSGHETRASRIGSDRFAYPDDHIEVDNRLSWFLGPLTRHVGPDAYYVHLTRSREAVAHSLERRLIDRQSARARWRQTLAVGSTRGFGTSIINAFSHSIVMRGRYDGADEMASVARFYVDTVNANIAEFLRDKPHMRFELERADKALPLFWERIGASGDFDAAMSEFSIAHNATR